MFEENRLIVALDDIAPTDALKFARKLQGLVWGFKVNSLFEANPAIVEALKPYGKVFVDLKIHEIPFTAGNEAKEQLSKGADIISIHASGGVEMMRSAKLSAKVINLNCLIVAITVLTSLGNEDCKSIYGKDTLDKVLQFSKMAIDESYLDGIVCSTWEVKQIKRKITKNFIAITPGIRLREDRQDDQKRIATPYKAIKNGADLLVIGRSITQAKNPIEVVKKVNREIKEALRGKVNG